jgi:hypothetical protein
MKDSTDKHGISRRAWLSQVAALSVVSMIQDTLANGDVPVMRGIQSIQGSVTVNGVMAKVGTMVKVGDRISTSVNKGSGAVVVIGNDAYMLREDTTIIFQASKKNMMVGAAEVLESLLISSGKVLSVFGKRPPSQPVTLRARSATIGIRGTGCYLEVQESRTYFCLCYGEASIDAAGMSTQNICTTHHEQPLWLNENNGIMRTEKADFGNHVDAELILLEKLTGREPPFVALGLTGRY